MEIGKTPGPARVETEGAQETRSGAGRLAPVTAISAAGGEAGIAAAAALAPQTQAYLSAWTAIDPASCQLLKEAQRIAPTGSPVLIRGEHGTGRKLLATLLHELSQPSAPLIHFDTFLPAETLETELFGFESAGVVQRGRIELAHGGTLIVDDVAALPLTAQVLLLRVIEESAFERPGGTRTVAANVRIVAVSSVDLQHAVAHGAFREDLYFCLNLSTLVVPPLRERVADICPLAERFLANFACLNQTAVKRFSAMAMAALRSYAFPGNVAELRQVVEHAASVSTSEVIERDHLPAHIAKIAPHDPDGTRSLEQLEREHIAKVLEFTRGRKTQAASILGISRKTLLEKRKRYGLG